MESSVDPTYWLVIGDDIVGPLSRSAIHDKLAARSITWETRACQNGAAIGFLSTHCLASAQWRPRTRRAANAPSASNQK